MHATTETNMRYPESLTPSPTVARIEDVWKQTDKGEKWKTITMSRMNIGTINNWYSILLA